MSIDPYSPVDQPKRTIAYGPLIWGTILIVVGAGWLLAALGLATLPWRAVLAAILIIVGVAAVAAAGADAPPSGLFGAGVTLSIILALLSTASSAFSLPLSGGVGDRAYSPTITTLEPEYTMVAGQMIIDLSDVDFPAGETRLEANVTFGRIVIRGIPDDVAVTVEGAATAGELSLLNSRWDGVGIRESVGDPDYEASARRLVIEARVGFGQIEVHR